MNRDMDLLRLILLNIEEELRSNRACSLAFEGYSTEKVAYHCEILYEAGLITDFRPIYADEEVFVFGFGLLTWDGSDFLEIIRDNSQWERIKDTISQNGLPMIIETIKTIANAFVIAAAKQISNSILKGTQ